MPGKTWGYLATDPRSVERPSCIPPIIPIPAASTGFNHMPPKFAPRRLMVCARRVGPLSHRIRLETLYTSEGYLVR